MQPTWTINFSGDAWYLYSDLPFKNTTGMFDRSQWPCGLRRSSAAACQLKLWVRIPPVAWMFFCCECCVLSGRGLCDVLIIRPEECYRLWCVVVCDLETSWMRRPWPTGDCCAEKKRMYEYVTFLHFEVCNLCHQYLIWIYVIER